MKNKSTLYVKSFFSTHLQEFYYRMLYLCISVSLCLGVCYWWGTTALFLWTAPCSVHLQTTYFFETLFELLKVCVLVAVYINTFFFAYLYMCFLSPGLYAREKQIWWTYSMCMFFCISFALFWAYKTIVPVLCTFFQHSQSELYAFHPRLSAFGTLACTVYMCTFVCVCFPFFACISVWCQWITVKTLCAHRTIVYVLCVLVSAFVCPPDVSAHLFLSCGLVCVCEVCVFVCCICACYFDAYS